MNLRPSGEAMSGYCAKGTSILMLVARGAAPLNDSVDKESEYAMASLSAEAYGKIRGGTRVHVRFGRLIAFCFLHCLLPPRRSFVSQPQAHISETLVSWSYSLVQKPARWRFTCS